MPRAHLSGLGGEAAAILLLTPLFLYAALWNGFPFMFFDSGAYVLEGFAKVHVPERSPVYSLFLYYVHGRDSLWYAAIAQSFLTAFAVTEFARALWPRTGLWKFLGVCAVLSLITSIAWFVGQIEPDCMTAVLVLALYPLFRLPQTGWGRAILLVLAAGFATGAHPSHLGLSAGLVIALALLKLAAAIWRKQALPSPNLLMPTLGFLTGLGLVMGANYALTEKVFVSRSGIIFLAARLMGDGVVGPTLDEICPTQPLKLCAYKDKLPPTADDYLWGDDSPFNKLGRFKRADRAEYETVVAESLKRHPLRSLGMGLWGAVRQFLMFRTGDGVEPQEYVLDPEFLNFMPKQYKAYLKARQQRGVLHFPAVNVVHYPVAFMALVWLAVVLWRAVRARLWNVATLPAFVLLALIGNALVCGLFSGPHDRYQSRIVWIAPFVLMLTERKALSRLLQSFSGPRRAS